MLLIMQLLGQHYCNAHWPGGGEQEEGGSVLARQGPGDSGPGQWSQSEACLHYFPGNILKQVITVSQSIFYLSYEMILGQSK